MLRTKLAAVAVACILPALLTSAAVARPARVKAKITQVIFDGAKHLKEDELSGLTSLHAGMAYDEAAAKDDCAAIVRRYLELGRPFAECTVSYRQTKTGDGERSNEVVYTIVEGPKVKVQRVEFVGNSFVSGAVLADHIESHKSGSDTTNFAAIADDVSRLTEYYRSFGFRDATVTYELQWNLDGREAVLVFHIIEGERHRPHIGKLNADQTQPFNFYTGLFR
jgi:outer membrane protein assembly factor BamA